MSVTGRYIGFLLFVIAVAVGSVIAAQIYWIYNAYKLEEKNFRYTVQRTLEEASQSVESNYGCFEVSNKIVLDKEEDILILHRYNGKEGKQLLDTVRQYATAFNEDSLTAVNFTSPFPLTSEILIKYHYTPLGAGTDFERWNAHNEFQRINKREQDEIFSGTHPITYVYGEDYFRTYIDSLIGSYLLDKDIEAPYQFLLKDEKSDSILLKSFSGSEVIDNSEAFTAGLYGNSYFFSPQKLYLWIPDQRGLLIGKMWLILTGSFLVLVFLGWGTAAMAKALLRQKKYSEVKMDFINNMTHEFKTPSANIGLAVETVDNLNLINGNIPLRKYLRLINSENSRMQENIERILQASLMDREQLILNTEKVHLDKLVEKVIESFDMSLKNIDGKVNLKVRAKNTEISGDKTHLSNIFYNLIDNAIKYNRNKPHISITIADHPRGLKVLVEDNGIGIPHAEQEEIFSRFYRVPTGNTHDVKGFGLGLSYVKIVVDAHGGEIGLKSSPGKGSLFKVVLPYEISGSSKNGKNRKGRKPWQS